MPIPSRAPQIRNNPNDHSGQETLIISEQTLRDHFAHCKDVAILTSTIRPAKTASGTLTLVFIYCEELCDTQLMKQAIFPVFREMCREYPCQTVEEIEANKLLPIELLGKEVLIDDLDFLLFNGDLLVYFQEADVLYSLTLAKPPNRTPDEPNTEVSIRGPKDGFIEEISKNVALIRKRIKSHKLRYEQFIVGTRSQTKVGLMYIDDIANREMIHEVKKRILQLNIDSLMSTNQLEEMIGDKRFSLFPLFAYTGRPDFAANCLLNGRFIILLDGAPTVIIGPGNLLFLLNTSEDNVTTPIFVVFQRILRFMGISVAIYLPGFWTALLSFHPGEIPFTLLGTVVLSRQGVPLPVPLEMFIMVGLFEIVKEAGMRLPLAIGQTLSIVGGLIIGESAVSAGLLTPGSLVVAAISVIASFTLVNQNLAGTVALLRFIVLVASSVLGLFGFIASLFLLLTYMVNLTIFGIPYLTPFSPPTRDIFKVLIPNGWKIFKKRADLVKPQDNTPKGGAN
jgi:spore germination protein KA